MLSVLIVDDEYEIREGLRNRFHWEGTSCCDRTDFRCRRSTIVSTSCCNCLFNHVDGGEGGRASIELHYDTSERLAKVNLCVNDKDYSLLNALSTGESQEFSGRTNITVYLLPGAINTLKISGGHGEISLEKITVSPVLD
ncbi:hypothetical protein R50345_14910 [Paenibacillus sp. FSL R5-0345]|uniref:hypothetical protein n=1 Tax=Paenibacillus sp. FSL R5-0345 TaxID=1536770 RepID=UPI0004F7358A|nr:hypothetical protein [Paenibacillus sp. FSL R5-0345]AIQ35801.1 hypothetical protein R50345_14910 [Paenibacillus sp. FSL R5-0345]